MPNKVTMKIGKESSPIVREAITHIAENPEHSVTVTWPQNFSSNWRPAESWKCDDCKEHGEAID